MENMSHEEDLVLRLIVLMRENCAVISEDLAIKVEMQLRQEFGGTRVYIPKAPLRSKQMLLATAIRSGANIKKAMAMANLARSTGFRVLSSKVRKR